MKYKAVIFDLDGVIVSTDMLHYKAWKYMADIYGIPFDQKINHRLRGVSRMASLDIILENTTNIYTKEEKLKMATLKNDYYVKLLSELTPDDILEGANALLTYLKSKDIMVAIGSSSKNAGIILKQIGLDLAFDVIADGNHITHSKPDPEVFLKAANMLGIKPEDCAVIEDAVAGIEAAKRANMYAVAIGDAKNAKDADLKIDSLLELIELF